MGVQTVVEVTVYCDHAFHHPLEWRLSPEQATKSALTSRLRSVGWSMKRDGTTHCAAHPTNTHKTGPR